MSKTKEDIFNALLGDLIDNNPGDGYVAKEDIQCSKEYLMCLEAMETYARQSCEPLEAKIKELEAKVNELTMADMTHEYNQAESEKFAPEYERQIREPLEARIRELEAKLLEALQKNVELCKMGLDLCDKVQSL